MHRNAVRAVGVALASSIAGITARTIDESKFSPADIIIRDVAVIGGGASGAYAAVRIKDLGKTVVVIDQSDHLGGHVNTYTNPKTRIPIDYGVQAYLNLPGSKEFFARFNITTEPIPIPTSQNQYIDFSTGKRVASYPTFDQNAQNMALGTYASVCANYTSFLYPGYFKLPQQIPEDLSMPFGQFVVKYKIQAAVSLLWTFANAVGDILNTPTIHVMQNLNAVHIQQLVTGGFFIPASHNNSQLYAAVQAFLGRDVLLNSKVSVSDRQTTGVKFVVKGCDNKEKLVKAKKLLVTIPPTKSNMYPFDLDAAESAVFSQFQWTNLQIGIFSGSKLPDGLQVVNTMPDSSLASYNLPKPPFVWQHTFTGVPGLYKTLIVGGPDFGVHKAKQLVRDSIKNIGDANTYETKSIDFEAFADHSPVQLRPSVTDLKAGFYSKLYALQGLRNTFYTGAAWTSDYSSVLWVFTETILPGILAGI